MKGKLNILQALSDETRIRIIMLLSHGEISVKEIEQALQVTQTKVSRHLGYLKNADIVTERRNANSIYYALNTYTSSIFTDIFSVLNNHFKNEDVVMNDFKKLNQILQLKRTHPSPSDKKKVLFICVHNSARSQIAESLLNTLGSKSFFAESAGYTPTTISNEIISVMNERNIDIRNNRSKLLNDIIKTGKSFHYVITVCTESQAITCPVFDSEIKRIHWNIPDILIDSKIEERLEHIRMTRDLIGKKVQEFIESYS